MLTAFVRPPCSCDRPRPAALAPSSSSAAPSAASAHIWPAVARSERTPSPGRHPSPQPGAHRPAGRTAVADARLSSAVSLPFTDKLCRLPSAAHPSRAQRARRPTFSMRRAMAHDERAIGPPTTGFGRGAAAAVVAGQGRRLTPAMRRARETTRARHLSGIRDADPRSRFDLPRRSRRLDGWPCFLPLDVHLGLPLPLLPPPSRAGLCPSPLVSSSLTSTRHPPPLGWSFPLNSSTKARLPSLNKAPSGS